MTQEEAKEILRNHNAWRRGAEIEPTNPTTLGEAIDVITAGQLSNNSGQLATDCSQVDSGTNLKPCPFCGSEVRVATKHYAHCSSCNIALNIDIWNRRTSWVEEANKRVAERIKQDIEAVCLSGNAPSPEKRYTKQEVIEMLPTEEYINGIYFEDEQGFHVPCRYGAKWMREEIIKRLKQ